MSCSINCLLVTTLIVCATSQIPIPSPAAIIAGWKAITGVYSWWTDQDKPAPQPLLILESNIFSVPPMLPVIWHQHIDGTEMETTPYQTLYYATGELLKQYPTKIDAETCKLYYKLGDNSDAGLVQITGDKMVEEMLKKGPDFEDLYRKVFIKCPQIESCNDNECNADKDKLSSNENNVQYQLAMNTWRYTKGHQIPRNEKTIEKYEQQVEDMGLSDFEVMSEAIQVVQQDLTKYEDEHETRCNEYGWEGKIKQTAWDAKDADAISRAHSNIEFDTETWILKGYWVRFSSFLNEAKDKISYTFTTSSFSIKVPQDQKEQTFTEKWLTGGGKVKNKFKKVMQHILRADGQQEANYNTYEPLPIQFKP